MKKSFKRALSTVLALCVLLASATCLMGITSSATEPADSTVVYKWTCTDATTNSTSARPFATKADGSITDGLHADQSAKDGDTVKITFDYYNPDGGTYVVKSFGTTNFNGKQALSAGQGSMDVTLTVTVDGGAIGPAIFSEGDNTGKTLYVWNVRSWIGDTEITSITTDFRTTKADDSNQITKTTYADVPFKDIHYIDTTNRGICIVPQGYNKLSGNGIKQENQKVRLSFDYYTTYVEDSNPNYALQLYSTRAYIHYGRGKFDYTFNMNCSTNPYRIELRHGYFWNIKLWIQDKEYPVAVVNEGGSTTYKTMSHKEFENTLGFSPSDETPYVNELDFTQMTADGTAYTNTNLAQHKGAKVKVTFKYFLAGDADVSLASASKTNVTVEAVDGSTTTLDERYKVATKSIYLNFVGTARDYFWFQVNQKSSKAGKLYFWDLEYEVVTPSTTFTTWTPHVYSKHTINAFESTVKAGGVDVKKVAYDEALFTCDAEDEYVESNLGNANGDAGKIVDICDLVFANAKASDETIKIVDIRFIDFNKNGAVDAYDLPTIRQKIFSAIA